MSDSMSVSAAVSEEISAGIDGIFSVLHQFFFKNVRLCISDKTWSYNLYSSTTHFNLIWRWQHNKGDWCCSPCPWEEEGSIPANCCTLWRVIIQHPTYESCGNKYWWGKRNGKGKRKGKGKDKWLNYMKVKKLWLAMNWTKIYMLNNLLHKKIWIRLLMISYILAHFVSQLCSLFHPSNCQ